MACSKGVPDMTYRRIKMAFSSWYDKHKRLTMLKVLFRDIIRYHELAKATKTIELLNSLDVLDVLNPRNLTILVDTISVTEQFSLQWDIKKHLQSFPDVKEGTISTHFKPYRLKLMKFGILLDEQYVEKIDDLYNNPTYKNYPDVWSMITDLEDRIIISPEEGKMNEFICDLESLQLDIQLALNALTKDKSPSMDVDGPTGEPVQKPDIQDAFWYRSNEKPIQKQESKLKTYKTTSGICLIINNYEFEGKKMKSLDGYKYDEVSLKNVFGEYFGFDVDVRCNQKAKDIEDVIYTYSKTVDYTHYDCFICCVLSHGKEGSVAGYDGIDVNITSITYPFRSTECLGLKNKPKLFFIQACMGPRIPEYVTSASAEETSSGYFEASLSETRFNLCPDDRDFLFGYSTVEGNKSFVYNKGGSAYIQALTKSLRNEPVKNMYIILTCVNDEVSSKEMHILNKDKQYETVMQVPFLKSTLSGQVIFSPKYA